MAESESIYSRRVVLADLCRRARPGGDWLGYRPAAFESKRTDTQWFFLDLPYAYLILFRGTEPRKARDWLTDLMFRQRVIPYGNTGSRIRVHRGFLGAYKSVRDQVHEAVGAYVHDRKPVVVLGHSLGGALATLCAVDLQYCMQPGRELFEHARIIHAYTFGSPRVGNGSFGRSYRRRVPRTWRYWGWWDIVVKVPPALFGYRHVVAGTGLRCRHDIRCYIQQIARQT